MRAPAWRVVDGTRVVLDGTPYAVEADQDGFHGTYHGRRIFGHPFATLDRAKEILSLVAMLARPER